jgi:hypothetical protein
MSAFEAYKEYIALKNHFTKADYDYIKYNGKTGIKHASFEKRKDKIFFEKLSKIENYHEFLIANLSNNPKLWIRDLAYSESAQLTYQNWKKRNQSLTYNFKTDFKKILEEPGGQQHPAALRLYLGNQISLESLCIFIKMTKAIIYWDSKLEYDPIWEDIRLRVVKYTPFIKFDYEKVKQTMLDIMNDMEYNK